MADQTTETPINNSKSFDVERIKAQLKVWAERLLDLKKSNPLLGINRSRVSKLIIKTPDIATLYKKIVIDETDIKMPLILIKKQKKKKNEAQMEMKDLIDIEQEPEIVIHPGDVEFEGEPKIQYRLLKRIYDNGRTTIEERGVTTLHLTFGILNWNDPILGESTSPLLLVPCQLESLGPNTNMRLKILDEELHVNPALEFYLRKKHHIDLPKFSGDKEQELTVESLKLFLTKVKACVKEQGWMIEETSYLSTFSFESLVIYQDLQTMIETAQVNPLIAALANARALTEISEGLGDEIDNLEMPKIVPIPVMTADASQLEALTMAKSGKHLVIKGPPGTGKSQTITNLIADAIGEGKKVLFVSAKMAALNVVHDRLSKLGLGRFCLEAHSTKAGKLKIIEELKHTLELPLNGSGTLLEEQLDKFKKIKEQLNNYVNEIHLKREPLGKTIYQAIGIREKLNNIKLLEFDLPWLDITSVDRTQLSEKIEALENLAVQSNIFNQKSTHPWRGFIVKTKQTTTSDVIKKNVQIVINYFDEIKISLNNLSDLIIPVETEFTLSNLASLSKVFNSLIAVNELPKNWLSIKEEELKDLESMFKLASNKAEENYALKKEYDKITSLSTDELIKVLSPLKEQFASWTYIINPLFWKWRYSIRSQFKSNINTSHTSLCSYLDMALALKKIGSWFESNNKTLSKYVSTPLNNSKLLKDKIIQFKTASELQEAISSNLIKKPGVEILTITPDYQKIILRLLEIIKNSDYKSAIDFVEANWTNGFIDGKKIKDSFPTLIINRCRELLSSIQKMHEWIILQTIISRCEKLDLTQLLTALDKIGVSDAPEIFKKRFYYQWIEAYLETIPALLEFTGPLRDEKVSQFKDLDKKLQVSMLKRIKHQASEPARSVVEARGEFGNGGEVGILRKELQKRKRIKPLRRLFNEIPHVLQALKPCMLMSPVSVSTFLKPGSVNFDLVVFDEASQLPTPEAIPSILRGKQIIVAGDENQLPPTTFFSASTIFEEENEMDSSEEYEPLESLLNNCIAIEPVFQESKIVWHYRSKDERLIQFSNRYFYNNSLITFPATTTDNENRGVHLVYTENGTWDRGRSRTNIVEARKVAEIVVEHFKKHPERSLGIASMNASQKEAIEIALDELISNKPELQALMNTSRPEPFFIKSLENVQGDERDTIIICIGYAKTPAGLLSLNFGPLNSEGGWRRLNVLVTRAKWQLFLVTSLRSHELDGINTSNKGAMMLRNYIQYVEQSGKLPSDPVTTTSEETNDFEDSIATALRDSGLIVDEQVGTSEYRIDLAIRDPRDKNRYIMAVECDGATYHHTRTARDRDILRQEVLQSQGWKIYRVWSTDWFRDRAKELEGILLGLESAKKAPSEESVQATPLVYETNKISDVSITEENIEELTPKRTRINKPGYAYKKFKPSINRKKWSSELMDPAKVGLLEGNISLIVKYESPIHIDLILERLKEVYGISRAGINIQRNVDSAIKKSIQWSSLVRRGKFMYKNGNKVSSFRIPSKDVIRDLTHIPPEEIENAILYLVEDQFGFNRELLPKAILEVFGIGSNRGEPTRLIESATDRLIDGEKLKLNGYTLYLS